MNFIEYFVNVSCCKFLKLEICHLSMYRIDHRQASFITHVRFLFTHKGAFKYFWNQPLVTANRYFICKNGHR